jgi:hypothetical protein
MSPTIIPFGPTLMPFDCKLLMPFDCELTQFEFKQLMLVDCELLMLFDCCTLTEVLPSFWLSASASVFITVKKIPKVNMAEKEIMPNNFLYINNTLKYICNFYIE